MKRRLSRQSMFRKEGFQGKQEKTLVRGEGRGATLLLHIQVVKSTGQMY